MVLAAGGLGGPPPLELRPGVDPKRHPRAARSLRYRAGLEVWTEVTGAGVLVCGRGLAGRHLTPEGQPLFAQIAPGNAASLRAVEAAGFRPIGAEVLFHRAQPP